jgi:hypothetical protein
MSFKEGLILRNISNEDAVSELNISGKRSTESEKKRERTEERM